MLAALVIFAAAILIAAGAFMALAGVVAAVMGVPSFGATLGVRALAVTTAITGLGSYVSGSLLLAGQIAPLA